jgi:predicted nucleic-acid-binding protein
MIGIDTNVLVRYLAQDDAKQSAIATRFIEQDISARRPGFVSSVVLVEACWVLKRLYAATDVELLDTVEDLLGTVQFHIEHREEVQQAVQWVRESVGRRAGLVDRLIVQIGMASGCSRTVSFDKGAVRSAGMTLLA